MADDDPNVLKGPSCAATLDGAARTLTFEHRGATSDPHGLNCSIDPMAFAQRVQSAVGIESPAPDSAEPPAGEADATAEPDTKHDAEGQAESKPDGKVTKAVDGVLDFFSRFN
jgi:hypothetical protein